MLLSAPIFCCSLACNLPGLSQLQQATPTATTDVTVLETLLPSQTPAPTSAPPTPTPQPAVRIDQADRALILGQNDLAEREYQAAYDQSDDPQVQAAAQLGAARVELQRGNTDLACACCL